MMNLEGELKPRPKEDPKYSRTGGGDFWQDYWSTIWMYTENKFNNPMLIAARVLAEKGFGVKLGPVFFDDSGNPDSNLVAIHIEDAEDRKALSALEFAPELTELWRRFYSGVPLAYPAFWHRDVEKAFKEIIEQRKLQPKLKKRLKKAFNIR